MKARIEAEWPNREKSKAGIRGRTLNRGFLRYVCGFIRVLSYNLRAMAARKSLDRFRQRSREFWERVTERRELEDLWQQFAAEARASYGVYAKEVDWEASQRESKWKRPFYMARALFWAVLTKLSPARRALLLLAVLLLVLIQYVNAGHNATILRRVSGAVERLEAGGLPLGIGDATPYASGGITLEQGAPPSGLHRRRG